MLNETSFIVRISGRKENSFYIDYQGLYKVQDIAKIAGLESSVVRDKYILNGAVLDTNLDVYYFASEDLGNKAINDILKLIKYEKGRVLFLTVTEIEFVRKALINESSNTIHVKNKIKDAIFKKLNA